MELDSTHRSLLLVSPIYTGTNYKDILQEIKESKTIPDKNILMSYGNSSIILSFLDVMFDYNIDSYIYTCGKDIYHGEQDVSINNISNPSLLSSDSAVIGNQPYYDTFVGFAKNGTIIHSIFVRRYLEYNTFGKNAR